MDITKIVITGGPCAGKSTAMSRLQDFFEQLGYAVLFIHETATELISGGVAPWTCGTNIDYQKVQLKLQLEKEKAFEEAAGTMKKEKILIVCDRGALDNKAYMPAQVFLSVLDEIEAQMKWNCGIIMMRFFILLPPQRVQKNIIQQPIMRQERRRPNRRLCWTTKSSTPGRDIRTSE